MTYHEDGNLRAQGKYFKGRREGYWDFYHKDGTIDPISAMYKEGVKID